MSAIEHPASPILEPRIARGVSRSAPSAVPGGDPVRRRIRVVVAVFALAYLALIGRLVMFGIDTPDSGLGYDAKPAACRSSRPWSSTYFSKPEMPWLSMLTRPRMCDAVGPPG
jgi:hypothetical protein